MRNFAVCIYSIAAGFFCLFHGCNPPRNIADILCSRRKNSRLFDEVWRRDPHKQGIRPWQWHPRPLTHSLTASRARSPCMRWWWNGQELVSICFPSWSTWIEISSQVSFRPKSLLAGPGHEESLWYDRWGANETQNPPLQPVCLIWAKISSPWASTSTEECHIPSIKFAPRWQICIRTIAVWLMPRSCKVQRDFNALAPIIVFQNPILCSNPWLTIGSEQNNLHRGSCVLPQVQQWRWAFQWRCAECSKHFHLVFEWHDDLILTYPHMLLFPCTSCTYNMHTCVYIYT